VGRSAVCRHLPCSQRLYDTMGQGGTILPFGLVRFQPLQAEARETIPVKEKEIETRVDPRVRRTRKLLIEAFMGLMKEQRFSSITIQNIAVRAGVNRATFYTHFEDKHELLNTLVRGGS